MKHPVDVYVGKRLRHRRWSVGMTQQQLGDAVGIKFQQIQKYETGMNRVSASRLWEIAAVLEAPITFFFDGVGQQEGVVENACENGEVVDLLSDKEALDLVRNYYSMPISQRRKLFDLARVMTEVA